MKPNFKCIALTAAMLGLLTAGGAQAQSAGSWMVRAGGTQITPHVESGDLTAPSPAGTKADINSATQFTGGVTYMLTDNISIDVPLGLPFKHEIVGAGAIAGVGKIGEVKVLPVTVLGQYRFLEAKSAFRPYVGAGLTYAMFFAGEGTAVLTALTGGTPSTPTGLSVASKFGVSLALGASVTFSERWFADANFSKTYLNTTTTLSTGQTLDATLNPTSFGLSVGYVF